MNPTKFTMKKNNATYIRADLHERVIAERDELLEALEMALKTTYSDKLHAEWTALIAKTKGE